MSATKTISALVAEIYDAARNPSQWGAALVNIAKHVGSTPSLETLTFAAERGDWSSFYLSAARILDLIDHAVILSSPGTPERWPSKALSVADATHLPNGCFPRIPVRSNRGDYSWNDAWRRRWQVIAPHIRRAIQISKVIADKSATVATFADTLDRLKAGMFLVDASGRILRANTSGHAMLADGAFVHSAKGNLAAKGVDVTCELREAVSCGNRYRVFSSIMNELVWNDAPVILGHSVYAFAIREDAIKRAFRERRAVAGIVVQKLGFDTRDAIVRIAIHYGLAFRERQVLEAAIVGSSVIDTGENLAISRGTAKTYRARLFRKTQTTNCIDLVKLCVAFRSPFSA